MLPLILFGQSAEKVSLGMESFLRSENLRNLADPSEFVKKCRKIEEEKLSALPEYKACDSQNRQLQEKKEALEAEHADACAKSNELNEKVQQLQDQDQEEFLRYHSESDKWYQRGDELNA